jgi:AraC-like DNA-binding protein
MSERFELPIVNGCGRTKCQSDWYWDTAPGLADHDLIMISGGRGRYLCQRGSVEAHAGSCLLFRKGERVRGQTDPLYPMTVTWVHFDLPAGTDADWLPGLARVLESPAFILGLLDRLLEAGRAADNSSSGFWTRAVLEELRRQDRRPSWSGEEAQQARAVEEICNDVRRDPGARWRVAGLARRLFCSPDHFTRLFRKFTGSTPGEFLLRTRIDAAMGLLRSSSCSVTRIAELMGYPDVFSFSRQFKLKTGLSPRRYRQEGV